MDGAAFEGAAFEDAPAAFPAAGEPIALIGAACRLPGAPDLDALARLLDEGRDAVTEIPDDRWTKAQYLHPERGQPGKAYTFAAGVIDDVYGFDPAFFGISPREAAQMDPQQRLLLELAHEAIEDAGLNGAKLAGQPVGIYVGGSSWDYSTLHVGDPSVTDAYSMTGSTLCSLANRISYAFDLHGPSFTVDTACSSSLVALHLACEAIRQGQVNMALVGGVNLLLAPQSYIGFCRASMLSPRGRCHAFDSRADGYVRAEGGGVIVLKPLRAALADGDRIRAVVRGTGVNSDGRTTGISLPSKAAQAALLREVYGRFGIDPCDLSYLEAHGTGTPAGDPIEAGALGEVLGAVRSEALPMGSVKTNIGHLEAGSGMAGLLKAMLVIQRHHIPRSLHLQQPNPNIPFDKLNLALVPAPVALDPQQPHLVGINSFGFGGTNAHAVLGSAPAIVTDKKSAQSTPDMLPPLLLSARSDAALRALAETWRDRLPAIPAADLASVLRAAAKLREQHPLRLAVLGENAAELIANLDTWLSGKDSSGAVAGQAVGGTVAFAFSGNGSQWAGMADDALRLSPAFNAALAEVDTYLEPLLGWSVRQKLRDTDKHTMRDTSVAQPLLFAVQVAITQALRASGITPAACFGHSVGEVAAAWAAGALSLEQASQVITFRSKHQQVTQGVGGMAVLGAARAVAEDLLAEWKGAIEIAAENSSLAVTVAGTDAALLELATRAEQKKIPFTRLDLDYAFHSQAMDPIRTPLLRDLAGLQPGPATTTLLSTVTGGPVSGTELNGEYWWHNVRESVRFADAARALVADGIRIFLEIGPQPVLQAYLHDALRQVDATGRVLATLGRRQAPRDPFALAAVRCHVAGRDISTAPIFDGPLRGDELPHYRWQNDHFQLECTAENTSIIKTVQDHPLLGFRRDTAADRWVRHLGLSTDGWLADHVVGGSAVMPAAAIIDLLLGAARARHPAAPVLEILDLEINRAVVLEAGTDREARLNLDRNGAFEFASRPRLAGDGWTTHAGGRVAAGVGPARSRPALKGGDASRRMDSAALYALTSHIGLEYGPAFQTVVGIDVFGADEALVRLAPDAGAAQRAEAGMLIDPPLLDGALQGLVALAVDRIGQGGTAVLPWRFGRVRLLRPEGAQPVRAHLRVTHAGPRAICADISLLDATGAVVLELLDCWFVSVTLAQHAAHDGIGFNIRPVPVADSWTASPAAALLATLPDPSDTDSPVAGDGEMEALGNAVAALAAQSALWAVSEPSDLRDTLQFWLDQDGLTTDTESDLPPLDALLRSILFDGPEAAADVALLARAAEVLPDRLRGQSMPALPAGLLDQFLYHAPAGRHCLTALADMAGQLARAWPAGRKLRVLEMGAGRGAVSTVLLQRLTETGGALEYTALARQDDLPALAETLANNPDASARAFNGQPAEVAELGQFDLVLGLHALSFGIVPAVLPGLLAPGGAVLLVEPLPNRIWTLLDLPASSDAQWRDALADQGLLDVRASALVPGLWNATLLRAIAPAAQTEHMPEISGPVLLLAAETDANAASLADALRQRGAAVTWQAPDTDLARMPVAASVVVMVDDAGDVAHGLAAIAALAAPLSAAPCPVTIGVRAKPHGDAFAAALAGLRRVMANEAPEIPCRLVRLDPDLPAMDAAAHLAREVLFPDADAEIAWTAQGRQSWRALRVPPRTDIANDAVLTVERPGLLDTLRWQPLSPQSPGPGDVAIQIRAAGLNFRDVMWAMGLLPDEALLHGFAGPTLGLECAGVITAVGEGVDDLRVGDRVMAFAPASLATQTVTRRHAVVKLPDGMTFEAAATVPVAFLTTAYAVGRLADLRSGETVLIHGGAGGVGLAAIQYALHRGATVIATAGSDSKRALLRQLGVAHVLDSRSLLFADDVMRITDGAGVDVVLNSLSGEAMERSLALLRPFGRFLELGKRDFYENTGIGLRPFRHNISYFAIDADQLPNNRPALAAELLAEVAALMREGALQPLPYHCFGFDQVVDAFRFMQGSFHIGKIVLVPPAHGVVLAAQPATFRAHADGTYLVTGGLSGFGLETARWLADQGARNLALLSRRGAATPDAEAAIAALSMVGVTAKAFACDVADPVALEAVLRDIRASMPPLRGVVHAAMVMDDAFLTKLDAPRFEASIGPKWHGAENLDRLTRQDPLDLFLLFSSITTALGNPGQGNYVAANAALEAIAERRREAGLPALAVGWGPIADVGYLARTEEVSEALARRLGSRHATAAEALALLPEMLASGEAVVMQADIAWGAARKQLPLLGSSLFAAMAEGGLETGAATDLRGLVAGKSAEDARDIVAGLLAEEIATILKLPADRIDANRPLTDLGMDSLMAVELRLAAETRFGVTLPLFSLAEGATLNALAVRLVKPLLGEAVAEDQVTTFLSKLEPGGVTTTALAEDVAAVPDRPSYAAQAQNAV